LLIDEEVDALPRSSLPVKKEQLRCHVEKWDRRDEEE
jgi:hypothetical protein